jgi:hypothetical protein
VGLLAALLLLIGTVQPARSQVLISLLLGDKVTSEKFHLGIELGLNVSNFSGIDGTKARTGFFLGIVGEWRFANRWYLQPELVPFYSVGATNMPSDLFAPPPEVEDLLSEDDVSRRLSYFAIPILVKYGVADNRLLLGVGPQVGFLTSATDTYKGTSAIENKITVDQDAKDSVSSTDAGVLFNVEWKVREGVSPSLVARYYLGLTDTITDNAGDAVTNQVFSILFTIPVGGDPAKKGESSE